MRRPLQNTEACKILLVEDDDDDALIIKELVSEGVQNPSPILQHSCSFGEAVACLENDQFDLCIFDYRLGEVDGLDLLRITRAKNIQTPIIFLTGQGDQEIAVQAMKAGATDYMAKSNLTRETLANSIRYAIKFHKEQKQRQQAEALLKKSHNEMVKAHKELKASMQKLQSAQYQVVRSEKLASIGRLAAGICHEILNPLNIISGHVQVLSMERSEDESLEKDLNSISEEIVRIEKIVAGLLKFSRKGDTDFKTLRMDEEIQSVLTILNKELRSSNIHLETIFDQTISEVQADSDKIRQVFLNIINNARHAMPKGGTLTIATSKTIKPQLLNRRKTDPPAMDGEKIEEKGIPYLRIKFSDTGVGIKKQDLNKIFDPFFTTKPEDQGTGLGLSVCHTIIEKHNGYLMVESDVGKGTSFIIDLPLQQDRRKAPPVKQNVSAG